MKVNEICSYLETIAPLSYQESFDNSGLILGHPDNLVSKVLLCLDLSREVMEEAIANDCNLIISHHPLIFKGVTKILTGDPLADILTAAIKNGISVYAIHTNLDNSLEGINGMLMKKIGISSFRVLSPKQGVLAKLATFCPSAYADQVRTALFQAGAGHIGNYDQCSFNVAGKGSFRASESANPFVGEKNQLHFEEEIKLEVIFPLYLQQTMINTLLKNHPYEEVAYDIYALQNNFEKVGSGAVGDLPDYMSEEGFFKRIKEIFQIPYIRHTKFRGQPVKRIAICSGSGSFLMQEVRLTGADVFLSGDLKYHDFFLPGDRFILADIGHYESEQWVKEWLYDVLIEKFPNFAVLISEINTNPVNYF